MLIEEMKMPQLGESVTEGTISKWLVSIGDKVNKYDPIAEVMTDKVNAEVPSSYTGVIKELLAEEGDTLQVGEVICRIEVEAVAVEQEKNIQPKDSLYANDHQPAEKEETEKKTMKNRYSPAVLRLAQEHDIDLEKVNGTGAFGRITRKDVLKLIEAGNIPKKGSLIQETKSYKSPKTAGDTEIPVSGVRKAIAQNMARSKTEIPHAWMMIEVDVTGLVELRNSIKEEFKAKEGFPLTFFPFFVKSVAEALKEYPQMNSTWAGDKIIQKKDINISIAVATDDALYVPVIKHADEKSIKGIAREINELALKVRTGTIEAKEMEGGTFTVNNTGSFGSIQSMGIINYPQAALLQVETIVKRLVVMKNGMIAVRDMVNLCLSLDHRVLDGVVCGRFLQRVKQILEGISKETTSVY
ncbi:2-oxo acid dehydrogenase subunit E2 [Bacillaceae bacterium ZC4]|uniref:Dihydrolipoamide acetyltransferase component of pyruvate dehydrogenase complex n=1 Tax=Aeribacillus pallidus TaxID=33936 RepID=A0A165XSV9_9BACI|nr:MULTISPECIES: dihydrolipoamide acetyltransferase family protein [Aeribacillus]AXI40089.1 2-oxo acid dehydrogenase subunit E2 [Bacillaceae bacterium ZC4]ASS91846.1 branched-chain alpha-keto acid dehydrogenase subunit E2 [Aeribacillus pallidus]KZM56851.1 branched-chain alpha-keto acid dehydrogenase subunit E2 [Aeribacillus pallidus]KZN96381.1 branched-chain alpha-keto acid dehydrogenase subunit E2 [Aeribacillus pallidus]MDR9792758.1 dihydrolipoamide acetyltransferase family protein [Aeribacil